MALKIEKKEKRTMGEIDFENVGFGTLAIHAGQEPDKLYGALATPIYQTSTFCFDTVEEGTAKFGGQIPGFCYSRGGNPTTVTLEKKIAMLEGGEACISTASGMGAVGGVMLGLLQAGDHESCVKIVLTVRPFIHIIRSTTGIHTRKKQRRKEAV